MSSFYSPRTEEMVRSEGKTVLFLNLTASSTFPYEFLLPGDADIKPEIISVESVIVWRFYLTINRADFFFFLLLLGPPEAALQIVSSQYSARLEMAEICGQLLPCVSGACLIRLHAYSVHQVRRRDSGHIQSVDHCGLSWGLDITSESRGWLGL